MIIIAKHNQKWLQNFLFHLCFYLNGCRIRDFLQFNFFFFFQDFDRRLMEMSLEETCPADVISTVDRVTEDFHRF